MSPLFLYNGLITPIVQLVGIIPVSRTMLNSFSNTGISSSRKYFINSFSMLSTPGDLLFLREVMCFLISAAENALLTISFVFSVWLSGILTGGGCFGSV